MPSERTPLAIGAALRRRRRAPEAREEDRLAAGLVFSTLGGILGTVIFRKKLAAPPVIDIPPSQL